MTGDRAEFLAFIERQMEASTSDLDDHDELLCGVIAAVVYYTDNWKRKHDDATLHEHEIELGEEHSESHFTMAHIAGHRPDDLFTLQVLSEQIEPDDRIFRSFRTRLGLDLT